MPRPDRWFLGYEISTIPLDVIGASDSDPDGDPLRVVYATQPAHGHTAVVEHNPWRYLRSLDSAFAALGRRDLRRGL